MIQIVPEIALNVVSVLGRRDAYTIVLPEAQPRQEPQYEQINSVRPYPFDQPRR